MSIRSNRRGVEEGNQCRPSRQMQTTNLSSPSNRTDTHQKLQNSLLSPLFVIHSSPWPQKKLLFTRTKHICHPSPPAPNRSSLHLRLHLLRLPLRRPTQLTRLPLRLARHLLRFPFRFPCHFLRRPSCRTGHFFCGAGCFFGIEADGGFYGGGGFFYLFKERDCQLISCLAGMGRWWGRG